MSSKNINTRINVSMAAWIVAGLLVTFVSHAARLNVQSEYNKRVEVALNKSTVLQLNTPVKKNLYRKPGYCGYPRAWLWPGLCLRQGPGFHKRAVMGSW